MGKGTTGNSLKTRGRAGAGALAENDCAVNEREAARRNRGGNGKSGTFRSRWPTVLLFHFNGTVGSAGTLMPRRSRANAKERRGDNL